MNALKKKLLWWIVGSLGVVGMGIMILVSLLGIVLLGVLVSSSDSSLEAIPVPKQRQFDIPLPLIPIYIRAENSHVSWARLAAIDKVATDFGQQKPRRYDTIGTLGFPRFLWEQYQVDGDGDRNIDVENPYDDIFSMAHYFKQQPENEQEAALQGLFLQAEDVHRVYEQEQQYASMLIIHNSWLWPVVGYPTVSSPYGSRVDPITGEPGAFHDGIDIPAPLGTPIVAIQDATVIDISSSGSGYGNLIRLQHAGGIQSFYGHLSAIAVKQGQYVFRGEVIGYVGSTGKSTGAHLHLGMAQNGQSINPQTFWSDQVQGE